MVTQQSDNLLQDDQLEKTKSLISALNYVSRDLTLPCHLYASVSSIYHPPPPVNPYSSLIAFWDRWIQFTSNLRLQETPYGGDLMSEFEDALSKQRPNCESASRLTEFKEVRDKTRIQHRLSQLEGDFSLFSIETNYHGMNTHSCV